MSSERPEKHLTVIVCAAGPAADVGTLVGIAQAAEWSVNLIATPASLRFLDIPWLEALSGFPVRTQPRDPATARDKTLGPPDAILVAPATFNTINKLAAGIADTYALTLLAEAIGVGTPTVILPFVNAALASRVPYQRSLDALRGEGLRIIVGEDDGWLPHPPGTGEQQGRRLPWQQAFGVAQSLATSR